MSVLTRWVIGILTVATVAIVVGPGAYERIDAYRNARAQEEADRLFAPVKAYYNETEMFHRQVRSPNPDPSLVPRARSFLSRLKPSQLDWNYGNAVHYANLYLGRVALKQGNVREARNFLLLAGKTPGSPQLDDYGPDMTLADELLQRGETEIVLQYFQECDHFWRGSRNYKLDQWMKDVQAGVRPDFGVRSGLHPVSTSHGAPLDFKFELQQ